MAAQVENPEQEQPAKHSKRWIWIPFLLVLALAAFFAIAGSKKSSFAFIDRLQGKHDESTFPFLVPTQEEFVYEAYRFDAKVEEVQKAFESEAKSRGWIKMLGGSSDISAYSETKITSSMTPSGHLEMEYALVGPGDMWGFNAKDSRCRFLYYRRKSWMERQYEKVKGWFGIKKPEPEYPFMTK